MTGSSARAVVSAVYPSGVARHHRTVAALGAMALVLAACGARVGPSRSEPELGTYGGSGGATSPTAPSRSAASSGSSSSTTAPGARPTAGPGASSTTTTNRSAPPGAGTVPLAPTTPGTYAYDQSGPPTTVGANQYPVPTQGKIVYDAPSGSSTNWAQVAHSYVDPSQAPTDTTYTGSAAGIAISQEVIRMTIPSGSGGQPLVVSFTCTFSPAVVILSWPVRVGYAFSGSGSCSGTFGSFTASVSGSVSGTQQTTLDGAAVSTYVVDTHVTTSGSVTSTDDEVDWFDPALRLDVHDESKEQGSSSGVSFTSDVTRTLVSGHPG